MDESFGRVTLITGASKGLGFLLAEYLQKQGFRVYAGVRDNSAFASGVTPVRLDVSSDQDCQEAIGTVVEREGRLDILVNNAASVLVGPTENFGVKEYRDILDVNAVGPFRLIREVVPVMRRQGGGKIINITSLNGLVALPNFGLYSSSKFALEALALSLRQELKKDNIWVTNIEPGAMVGLGQSEKKIPHLTARDKFWLLRYLLPLLPPAVVARKVLDVLKDPRPPAQILLGRDAQITFLLQRFLPQFLWDALLSFVWNKK